MYKFLPITSLVILSVFGLCFRVFWWCDIPITSGDAYGSGDLLDLLIGATVYALSGVVLAQSLCHYLWKRFRDVKLASFFLALSILTSFTFMKLHRWIEPICS